jgi:hypothetical protein
LERKENHRIFVPQLKTINPMMTIQELQSVAPSVFNTQKANKLSDRYVVVPTIEVVNNFIDAGWQVASAKQVGQGVYGKHSVRLRNADLPKVGDSLVEAIITNSHDGRTKLQVGAGLYRLVCSNGLVVPMQEMVNINQRHMNIQMDEVYQITEKFLEISPMIERSVNRMMEKTMSMDEKIDFTTKAIGTRWKNTEDISTLTLETIIDPLRVDDFESTLWNTFNVVQEKLIRGGFVKEQGRNKRTVKPITSLNMDTMINQKLWELAETFI